MKLIESIVCCSILAMFSVSAVGIIIPCVKNYKLTEELKNDLERDKFIVNSFINLISKKSESELKDSLIEWKQLCLDLWPLDYLRVYKKEDCFVENWSFGEVSKSIKISLNDLNKIGEEK